MVSTGHSSRAISTAELKPPKIFASLEITLSCADDPQRQFEYRKLAVDQQLLNMIRTTDNLKSSYIDGGMRASDI